jgi:hypothetical protein
MRNQSTPPPLPRAQSTIHLRVNAPHIWQREYAAYTYTVTRWLRFYALGPPLSSSQAGGAQAGKLCVRKCACRVRVVRPVRAVR